MSRRAKRLSVRLIVPASLHGPEDGLVIAIDATGLSLHSSSTWHRFKHDKAAGRARADWRKLHVAVDAASGLVVSAAFGPAREPDHGRLPALVAAIEAPIRAACADMGYDKHPCRAALHRRGIRQVIPPLRKACLSRENPNLARNAAALGERDNAVAFIRQHTAKLGQTKARAPWKHASGYHASSQVETACARLKTHTSASLSNRSDDTRQTQAFIRCKAINTLACA